MARRGDKVEHGVDSVVPETGVTLDTRLLRQNIVVLSLKITNDLREAIVTVISKQQGQQHISQNTHLASLSIWSPKPGVSTMVKEIRVPSSSNSSSARCQVMIGNKSRWGDGVYKHTDCDGLDLDAVLDVSTVGVIGLLVREHRLAAQGVDEGGSAWRRRQG